MVSRCWGSAAAAAKVYAANDAVFEDIAAGFSELCSSLLPSLELQLERTGEQAHHGLQFRSASAGRCIRRAGLLQA